ncbi:hypothetical protein GG681_05455 [Epibacterium sp. SM1969]|uniref:Uncharacterized protein n=1 Tax=Tritonibacter aquimaris TaxID=2663379 RepID=A0A844AR26_9RHOB|nr:hypothetical protein [Tritonibacter aquimaris]MQY42077.1 hypothetical protein [Tritonibacter aquimaris]
MFRFVLLVALCIFTQPAALMAAGGASFRVPQVLEKQEQTENLQALLPPCYNTSEAGQPCVRVLACIGDEGVYFDGQARGEGVGIILGRTNTGLQCSGHWGAHEQLGAGRARLKCGDGSQFHLNFASRDGDTGTTISSGKDSQGRMIRAWSGANVLHFLDQGDNMPNLKCGDLMVPLKATAQAQ